MLSSLPTSKLSKFPRLPESGSGLVLQPRRCRGRSHAGLTDLKWMIIVSCDVCVTRDVVPRCRIGVKQAVASVGEPEASWSLWHPQPHLAPGPWAASYLPLTPACAQAWASRPNRFRNSRSLWQAPGAGKPCGPRRTWTWAAELAGRRPTKGLGIDVCSAPKSSLYPTLGSHLPSFKLPASCCSEQTEVRRFSQQVKWEKVVKSAISQRSGDGLEGAEGWETLARSMQRKNEGRSLRMAMARPEEEVHPRKQSRSVRVAERRPVLWGRPSPECCLCIFQPRNYLVVLLEAVSGE